MIDNLAETASAAFGQMLHLLDRMIFNSSFVAAVMLVLLVLAVDFHRRFYRFDWPRRMVESVCANISIYAVNIAFAPAVYLTADWVQSVYDGLGVPHIDPQIWQDASPWLLAPLAVLAHDFANYWNHRLMHRKALWPIHAIHHSDPDVTGLTAYRVHFLEPFVMFASYTVLLSWLGFPKDAMGLGALFIGLHTVYVHINVDWGHGPLRLVIASPRFHRWHHANVPEAYGKNLANLFPFFDLLFGTYYLPGRCIAAMGAPDVPENDVARLVLYPFTEWRRAIAAAAAGAMDRETAGRRHPADAAANPDHHDETSAAPLNPAQPDAVST